MLTENYIEEASDIDELVDVDNVLDYCPYINNIDSFSIKAIDKYSEKGNVSIYIVIADNTFEDEGENITEEILFAVHIDYDNRTFAFDKSLVQLADAVNLENLGEIDNNGSNTF